MTDRPNFLFVITDQQRADWLGCMGHPVLKTPNIDAIAQTGTAFEDFHVAMPVCMPNRASLMTGRMPSVHGLRYNGCALPLRANTFVDVLKAAGYRTASIGKSHLQPFLDAAPLRGDDGPPPLIAEAWKPETGNLAQEEPGSFASGRHGFEGGYYGFDHVEMVTGHGDKCGGHYGQWFRQKHPDWAQLHDSANELPHNYSCPQAYRTPIPEDSYPTTWVADRACDYIEAATHEDAPFFAFVSFPDPHHPFNPPGKYWDLYSPDDFELTLPYEAHENPPPPLLAATELWESGKAPQIAQMSFRADARHIKEAMALSAGMIAMIDDQVGRLMETLKETGQYDNTVVIFTSDHGDYMGDFNLLLKGPLMTQAITRVPMIWSDPSSRKAVRTPALASTIDLPASILDRAGLRPYWGMQGRSFLPALGGGAHRDVVLTEHNTDTPRMGLSRPARVRSLRTKEWRLSLYAGEDWGELYDLAADPGECRNLWDDPAAAAAKAELSLLLAQELALCMDESPRSQRLA